MKRGGDLAVAVLAGVIAIPLVLVIALLVRSTMGGPVIFRQLRTGRGGDEFEILKFRTMRDRRFPEEEDAPRVTRLGLLLRRTSLDELPQLWNVVRGDMGVVGPRPTLPEQVVHYSPRQRGRLAVRPGLTGWAQVQGRNSISWPERIELDLWYIEHHSLLLDLRILFRTVGVLLRPVGITGAGGVNPGFPAPSEEPSLPQPVALRPRPRPAAGAEPPHPVAAPRQERGVTRLPTRPVPDAASAGPAAAAASASASAERRTG